MLARAYLECAPVWTNNSLSPLNKSLFIPHNISNFDDIASNTVVQYLDGLANGNSTSEQFDHVASFEDYIWVISFTGCPNRHRTVNKV